jgi:hypothetical protein
MKWLIPLFIVGILLGSGIGQATVYVSSNSQETYDLVIIAPQVFCDELQVLADHKDSIGITTLLQPVEEIYDEWLGNDKAEQVKVFITHAKETYDVQYVMLVGGRKVSLGEEEWLLPVRYSHIEDNVETPEARYLSDLYFADLYDACGNFSSWDTNDNGVYGEWYANQSAADIIDLYPDVYIGRLPCRNLIEVKIMVQKIITYEQGECAPSWFNKFVVVGGDTYTDNDYYEGEVATQQAIDFMTDFEPVKLWTSDGSFQNWLDVVRTISKGSGFLFFAGHGSPSAWGTHPPYDDSTWIFGLKLRHMPLLFNKEKLPICVVGGCHNSMFNISLTHLSWTYGLPVPECWSWWLTRKIGGGAIATIGCTGLGYGKEDKQEPDAEGGGDWLNVLFFKQCGQNHTSVLGKAWGEAITSYIDEFPIDYTQHAFNDTALDAKTVQEWALFGDPSLNIGGYHWPFSP